MLCRRGFERISGSEMFQSSGWYLGELRSGCLWMSEMQHLVPRTSGSK